MNDLPTILVVSSSNTKPKSIIRLLTKENPSEQSELVKQSWKIDTKYYSAVVNFIGMSNTYSRSIEFNEQVEALLIHMDSNKSLGLDDLKQWDQLQSEVKPEIKLLLANYCNEDTKITKSEALTWCSSRGFELVELYPSESPSTDSPEENIISEKVGVSRVLEALQAHTWSNLVLKKIQNSGLRPKSDVSNFTKSCTNDLSVSSKTDIPDDFLGDDDFTELFSQLHMMKDSLQSLPMEQRKQCAQQMVSAFWQAIGGDDEELLDV